MKPIEYLSLYLPKEVKIFHFGKVKKLLPTSGSSTHWIGIRAVLNGLNSGNHEEYKLILRPMSDLTKEIEHNGEVFVPLQVIFNLLNPFYKYDSFNTYNYIYQGFAHNKDGRCVGWIEYVKEDNIFHTTNGKGKKTLMYNQIKAWEKMFSWHFDVFNLHEKGLCIYYDEIEQL